ncbi:MAG: hypothetical protein ACU0CI_11460 [Shimia sp.]
MRLLYLALFLTALTPCDATAQEAEETRALGGLEFEALSRDRVLAYARSGARPYGWELHLPNRRVLWTLGDGTCKAGTWRPVGDAICFQYEGDSGEHCWRYTLDGPDIIARLLPDPIATYSVRVWEDPIDCPEAAFGS